MDKMERKQRIQHLLTLRHEKMQQQQLEHIHQHLYSIYNDCSVMILNKTSSAQIEEQLTTIFPFASWGRIDWKQVEDKVELTKANLVKLVHLLRERNIDMKEEVYVISGIFGYPVVQTTFDQVLSVIDDIYELGPDQWIFYEKHLLVVEFTHDEEIILGVTK